jgi:hypothetical protein
VIDTDDHEGIDAVAKRPSRAGALLTVVLAIISCAAFGMFWGYIIIITGQGGLP